MREGEGGGLGVAATWSAGRATHPSESLLHVAGSTLLDKVVHVYLALNAVASQNISPSLSLSQYSNRQCSD